MILHDPEQRMLACFACQLDRGPVNVSTSLPLFQNSNETIFAFFGFLYRSMIGRPAHFASAVVCAFRLDICFLPCWGVYS